MKLSKTNEWGTIISSVNGTRPGGTSMGASITPTQNTTGGAYATLLAGASVTEDVYAMDICINNIATSAAARDAIATLGFDPAGGTSFTDFVDLLCGQTSTYGAVQIGTHYHFPIWLKSGTTIGMRGSVNSATLTAFQAFVRLYCRPSRPELIWCGQKIEQLGVTVGTSTGTSVTPGTVSEGSWTSMGTTSRDHRFFEFGFGANDGLMNNNVYHVDVSVGDASNKKIIGLDRTVSTNNSEAVTKLASPMWATSKNGDIAYVRMQVGGNGTGTISAAVYAMGD